MKLIRSENIEAFLRDAAIACQTTEEEILARVFHLRFDDLHGFKCKMQPAVQSLFAKLDYGLRVRNPGLHYVSRHSYIGYRREQVAAPGKGERSQVFVSVLRKSTTLTLVLPLNPDELRSVEGIRDLRGIGHHGIGDTLVAIEDEEDLRQFFIDFAFWVDSKGDEAPTRKLPQ